MLPKLVLARILAFAVIAVTSCVLSHSHGSNIQDVIHRSSVDQVKYKRRHGNSNDSSYNRQTTYGGLRNATSNKRRVSARDKVTTGESSGKHHKRPESDASSSTNSNKVSKKDLAKMQEMDEWKMSCESDRNPSFLSKDDILSLQACDILNATTQNNSGYSLPQPATIINTTYRFRSKILSTFDGPSCAAGNNGTSTTGTDALIDICSLKVEIDLRRYALPFCSHLSIGQVLKANVDLSAACSEVQPHSSLKFCPKCSEEVLRLDRLARLGYCALEGVLDRADCKIPYTPTNANCSTCKNAYRIWLCSQFFEKLLLENSANKKAEKSVTKRNSNAETEAQKNKLYYPCPTLCHNVMKMCPYQNPIWDDASQRSNSPLEPVEYSGWPSFHCPSGLSPGLSEEEHCYADSHPKDSPSIFGIKPLASDATMTKALINTHGQIISMILPMYPLFLRIWT